MTIIAPTPAGVKAITGSTLDDAVIQVYIDAAECIITQIELCINGKGISDSCITNAITYLSAHIMGGTNTGSGSRTVKKESLENFSVEYAVGSYDSSGVISTPYGSTANALTGGCLQEVDMRSAGFFFGGGA